MAKKNQPMPQRYQQNLNTTPQGDDTLIDIDEVKDKVEHFSETYGKYLYGGIIGLFILVGGFFGYKHFVKLPKEKQAAEKIFHAQAQFQKDSFNNALLGQSGNYEGMLDMIDKYSGTATGNLALYYAGVACLQNGQYDDAIKYLSDFSTGSDMIQALAYGALGDAYSEKNDMDSALKYYGKAVSESGDEFTSPYYLWKKGLLLEHTGKLADAKACFQKIKEDFPKSSQAEDADLYIARVSE